MSVDLFDSLTRAAKQMPACCVKTMNYAIDVHPEKRKTITLGAEGGAITLTFTCPACGRNNLIRAMRGGVKVESAAPSPSSPA